MNGSVILTLLRLLAGAGLLWLAWDLGTQQQDPVNPPRLLLSAAAFLGAIALLWANLFRLATKPLMLFIDLVFSPGGRLEKPVLNLKLPAHYLNEKRHEEALAEDHPSLRRVLGDLGDAGFTWEVQVLGVQVAALLRSWSAPEHAVNGNQPQDFLVRLLIACVALGLPLAVAGILPQFMETAIGIPNTIAPDLGNPPSAVAAWPVWAIMALPLLLGLALVQVRPRVWPYLGAWPNRLSRFSQLEWLFRAAVWGVDRVAAISANGLGVVEGAGALGWFLVFMLLAALLV